jgi:hypothetical protein
MTISAILFDQGDTLWQSLALCGMRDGDVGATFRSPAGGLKASPTFESHMEAQW